MTSIEHLDRARAIYRETRQIWLAGGLLDAQERLAVATVAAGLRRFAFLNHLGTRSRKAASELLSSLGLRTRVFSARVDVNAKGSGVSAASAKAYNDYRLRNDRFLGLGVWPNGDGGPAFQAVTITNLGSVLEYPGCCVEMDVQTKRRDHQLALRGLVNEVGDDPAVLTRALRSRCAIEPISGTHVRKWHRRLELTAARFPFALHAACDECLKNPSSPTAVLSASYEHLAREVSEELHFLVRWASHIVSGGLS
jgi:hypothetical protein